MDVRLERDLSKATALEKHDTTALNTEQQDRLNQHKVGGSLEFQPLVKELELQE